MKRRYRDPHEIAPIDGTQELLLAIFDALEGLRADLRVGAEPAASDDGIVTEEEASEAGRVLGAYEGDQPEPATPPKRRAARKPAAKKKVTTRKKA